jgi:hypothetical protein
MWIRHILHPMITTNPDKHDRTALIIPNKKDTRIAGKIVVVLFFPAKPLKYQCQQQKAYGQVNQYRMKTSEKIRSVHSSGAEISFTQ